MWTLVVLAVSALLWLVRVTLGAEGAALDPDVALGLYHAALGSSVLAGVLVLQRLLQHVVRERQQDRPATSDLLHAVLRIALYLVALMLYLRFGLHLDISSVLATSAMMSVVIGLALQPTLGHLFAGVSMEIERPLKVGDFVRRDDQLEGQVTSLNWRSVYLRTERGSTLVLPNSDFTSKLIEVIPGERPYRHQVSFHLPSDVPPDRVIHIAQQVVRSDLPGVCRHPVASVVVVGNDPIAGTLRYVARLYTLQFLDRSSMASAFLERLWYALSREGLALLPPPVHWWPTSDAGRDVPDDTAHDVSHGAVRGRGAETVRPPVRLRPVQAGQKEAARGVPPPLAVPWPGALPEAVTAPLLQSAQRLSYGPREACPSYSVCLVLDGRLREERPLEAHRAGQALRALLSPEGPAFKGRFYDTQAARLEPFPLRKPGFPLWIGSWGSPAGLRRVARLADASRTRTGPTNVPLVLPRSRTITSRPAHTNSAWRRLTFESLMTMSHSRWRPTT